VKAHIEVRILSSGIKLDDYRIGIEGMRISFKLALGAVELQLGTVVCCLCIDLLHVVDRVAGFGNLHSCVCNSASTLICFVREGTQLGAAASGATATTVSTLWAASKHSGVKI